MIINHLRALKILMGAPDPFRSSPSLTRMHFAEIVPARHHSQSLRKVTLDKDRDTVALRNWSAGGEKRKSTMSRLGGTRSGTNRALKASIKSYEQVYLWL